MKFFTAKYLSMLLLASSLTTAVVAYVDEYRQEGRSNCGLGCNQYECSCNPLYCGALDLQIQGGVDPILWRQRGPFNFVTCAVVAPASPVVSLFDTPKFSTFFRTPWTIGGQIGYAWSDNTRVYAEFDYAQAKAKTTISIPSTVAPVAGIVYNFTLSKYKLYDFYVGARYYTNRWCDRYSFFIGGKVGLVHHKAINFSLTASLPPAVPVAIIPTTPVTALFSRNTSVSGGANVGVDVCFCGNWSLVITGEVVASCGPKANTPVVTAGVAGGALTAFLPPSIVTELQFPITAGVRYSF